MTTYTDNFNRADNASLGASWYSEFGIVSNKASVASGGWNRSYYNTDVGSADMFVQADVTLNNTFEEAGLIGRAQSDSDYYKMKIDRGSGGTVYIYKTVGYGDTQLASGTITISTGVAYTLRFEIEGTALRAYVNGSLVVSTTDSTFAGGTGSQKGGIGGTGSLSPSTFDNFSTGDYASTTPKTDTESGTGTDAMSVLSITRTETETGTGTDAASIAITSSDTESGAGTEGTPAVAFSDTETGTGTDGGESVTVPVVDSDSGTGTDAGTSPPADLAQTETGTGTDAEVVGADLAKSDTDDGTGTDAEGNRAFTDPESATASDAESVQLTINFITDSDTGQGYMLHVRSFKRATWMSSATRASYLDNRTLP